MAIEPIDYSWLIEACGEDEHRFVELLLLVTAAGSLAQAFEVTDLHRARIQGYRNVLAALVKKAKDPAGKEIIHALKSFKL